MTFIFGLALFIAILDFIHVSSVEGNFLFNSLFVRP